MQQWEYYTAFFHLPLKPDDRSKQINKQLNKFGTQGWELVNFQWHDTFNIMAIFKRPVGIVQAAESVE